MNKKFLCGVAVYAAIAVFTATAATGRMPQLGHKDDNDNSAETATVTAGVTDKIINYTNVESSADSVEEETSEVGFADYSVGQPEETVYASSALNVRVYPSEDADIYDTVASGTALTKVGNIGEWFAINYDGDEYYVHSQYTSTEMPAKSTPVSTIPTGAHLTKSCGRFEGPWGTETYYNLPMGLCIKYMGDYGYSMADYWVREDGVKMLGRYVMCAANLHKYPRGSVVQTSLGAALVVDTGTFTVNGSGVDFDICVTW